MSAHLSSAAFKAAADRPPEIIGVAEILMADITGAAVGDDGETIGVRGLDATGQPIVFTFRADYAEVFIAAINQACRGAAEARAKEGAVAIEQKLSIARPEAFHVGTSEEIDGVVLAFDPGTPHMQCFGFPLAGALGIANAIASSVQAQHAKKPRLIVPR